MWDPSEGSPTLLKKIFVWGGIGLLIYAVSQKPTQYASAGKHGGGKLMEIADGIANFFAALFS